MPDHLSALRAILGPSGLLTGQDTDAYAADWRGLYHGTPIAVARPATTAEVAATVRYCAENHIAVVPQGGNTGLAGGATPQSHELVLLTSRLTRLRALDPLDMTMTIEAGVTLKAAQELAANAGRRLPLSISAEGTAQIGGILSTNAGGNNTLRFGNARDLVLGLEVVLSDGEIWNGLRRLRKDNTGYCLRHLFVGAEGTLGIITAAVLKLVPAPQEIELAFCAVPSEHAAQQLFGRFQAEDAAALNAFEYMSGLGLDLVLALIPGVSLPLETRAPHYLLIELTSPRAGTGLRAALESVLEKAFEDGLILDAAIAESEAQRRSLWKLREEHAEAQRRAGASIKNDVSVPVSHVADFLVQATAACRAAMPEARVAPFGHMGDGNIHFNLIVPEGGLDQDFLARQYDLIHAVEAVVRAHDGSFSAEHGIGQLKLGQLAEWRGGPELDLMRKIKQAIDPADLMNPGKLLPKPDTH